MLPLPRRVMKAGTNNARKVAPPEIHTAQKQTEAFPLLYDINATIKAIAATIKKDMAKKSFAFFIMSSFLFAKIGITNRICNIKNIK